MRVKAITMAREKAKREWKEYLTLLKNREGEYVKELKQLKDGYYHLSKGRKIIDIYEIINKIQKGAAYPERAAQRVVKKIIKKSGGGGRG